MSDNDKPDDSKIPMPSGEDEMQPSAKSTDSDDVWTSGEKIEEPTSP
jgi:hypothetical protein